MAKVGRRQFNQGLLASGLCLGLTPPLSHSLGAASKQTSSLLVKTIPSTGQSIPVIGMGTWITFNVGRNQNLIDARAKVLEAFFNQGGRMVDSSPMYGSSEAVIGACLTLSNREDKLFSATKTWTSSTAQGPEQFKNSQRLWGIDAFDLIQVHNLVNWRNHLAWLRERKQDGQIGHIGVTTSHGRRHAELTKIIQSTDIDFVQLTYNVADREAELDVLPLAMERGIAVIANRPLQGGRLMDQVEGKALPDWCKNAEIYYWSQYFLSYIASHPAVTCAIPATSRPEHMLENMQACRGTYVDQSLRKRMLADWQKI